MRTQPRRGTPVRLACLVLLALAVPAAGEETVDLEGTWHVLVHYKDDGSPNPDQERWDDRIWVFERKGRKLRWTEYPIAVFDDTTGRFERRSSGQYARILHYWEPNASQRANIEAGVQVNNRGSKRKTLRGSDEEGWSSGGAQRASSASVITYSEVWTIEGMPDRPVFSRADFMSGARTDSMEGLTRYAATAVRDGGDVVTGRFERDESRHGTFRMVRSGAAQRLKGKKDQRELHQQAMRRSASRDPELRGRAREAVEQQIREAGVPLGREEIDTLATDAIEWTLQGVPGSEVDRRIGEAVRRASWSFAPIGASHDDAARYRWPFDASRPRSLVRGVGAKTPGAPRPPYAFEFALPVGTPVLAARDGVVVRTVDAYARGGRDAALFLQANAVVVLHEDGTFAIYRHLSRGVRVEPRQAVQAGDALGVSGETGYVDQPLLFFGVMRLEDPETLQSVPIRFDDGTAQGLVPVAERTYGGG